MYQKWLKTSIAWLGWNHRGLRLFIGLICIIALSLFLHFREVRVEILELNATASRYVVAQVDFEFPDYETTLILRQMAVQDIGTIYKIEDGEVHSIRLELENRLVHDRSWRFSVPSSTFEELYKIVDAFETILLQARFTDPRTLQKIKELNILEDTFYEFVPDSTDASIEIPSEVWTKISQKVHGLGEFQSDAIQYVQNAFSQKKWMFIDDVNLVNSIRSQISSKVVEKWTWVPAGTRIIDQGEIVSSRHLTMMQAMKQALSENRKLDEPLPILATLLLSFIFVAISGLYFRISQPGFLRSISKLSLFGCIVILTLCFAKFIEYVLLKSTSNWIEGIRYPIVAPFATILICILLSPRIALFAAAFLSIILSVSLAVDHSRFLILNLITSIVVIITTKGLSKRKDVFAVCMKSWGASILILFAYSFSEGRFWSTSLMTDFIASFAFLALTAVLVVGLLPILESLFGVLTDMTLMEYMDPNNELLRKLAIEVPGTYQHSIVLGNLAEACALAIGRHGLFCRAATLYHDVGKMLNPQFYTENQQSSVNIHQLLTPIESAQVIISHVTDGEVLARKYHLPEPFIDIIREHHGTTLVYYFYRKQLELKGGRVEEVDEKAFRYPGPKPKSKESAIIMICDTIEAASRSVEEVSEENLTKLVDRLIAEKAEENQFDDCQLTFEELTKIKKALVKSLLLAQHTRIKYPKRLSTKSDV